MDEMKMRARATCDTGLDGKGLTSTSEPVRSSLSSCQPGNVASRMKVKKARIKATIRRYGKTTASLKVAATQTRFSGSWSIDRFSTRAVALLEQM